jgi:hypothetical protein
MRTSRVAVLGRNACMRPFSHLKVQQIGTRPESLCWLLDYTLRSRKSVTRKLCFSHNALPGRHFFGDGVVDLLLLPHLYACLWTDFRKDTYSHASRNNKCNASFATKSIRVITLHDEFYLHENDLIMYCWWEKKIPWSTSILMLCHEGTRLTDMACQHGMPPNNRD